MPSVPGSFPVIMLIQAGTVIGGVVLSSGPYTPESMSRLRFGRSARNFSNTSSGAAQSRPMMQTLEGIRSFPQKKSVQVISLPERLDACDQTTSGLLRRSQLDGQRAAGHTNSITGRGHVRITGEAAGSDQGEGHMVGAGTDRLIPWRLCKGREALVIDCHGIARRRSLVQQDGDVDRVALIGRRLVEGDF